MGSVGRFISLLMHSRTQAHVFHLDTKSFAMHKALDNYYTSIVPLLDSYAEAYKGRYGNLNRMTPMNSINRDPTKVVAYFQSLLNTIQTMNLPTNTPLRNIQDEIEALIMSTIYMTRNLK